MTGEMVDKVLFIDDGDMIKLLKCHLAFIKFSRRMSKEMCMFCETDEQLVKLE